MLIDMLYAFYQLSFLGFVIALVKHHRSAWGFLIISYLLSILTMQAYGDIDLSHLHYYTAEIILMGISIIGFISYNKDCKKNIFQKITTTKTIILFIISMIISLLIFYVLIYTVLRVYFTIASISFSISIMKHLFIIFALLLAIANLKEFYSNSMPLL
jgi:hypothetical protein